MSGNQKLILAAMALLDIVVLCGMVVVVVSSMANLLPPAVLAPAPVATLQPTDTSIPTWTPTPTKAPGPTETPRPTHTPTWTPTPWSVQTIAPPTLAAAETPTATLPPPKLLENPTFDDIRENDIPGWQTGAFVNWAPGNPFDPATSYAAPRFHKADDPDQRINGSTLQIDTVDWVKLRACVFQTVTVQSGSRVTFRVRAAAVVPDTAGGYFLKAGVDPAGGNGCDEAQWSGEQHVNQTDGVVTLVSPEVMVGEEGTVTVCMFAETQYAQVWHAAFFDDAKLDVTLPTPIW
jgi:hypothetical protein